MLGGLREIGSAVVAVAGCGCAERTVAAVAVLEWVSDGRGRRGRVKRRWGWQLGGEAVGEEGGGAAWAFGWEVGGEGVAYGGGGDVAFQPGGDAVTSMRRVAATT
jgi:hypothetical protein